MKRFGSREKGHKYELEVGKALGLNRELDQAREGGCDLEHPALAIECKRVEHLHLDTAMAQVIAAANGRIPVVIHRKNRTESLVTMRLSDWLAIYEQRWKPRPAG